ncbi:MAG TPA: hypothetical protein VGE47_17695 [Burkholderiaceae bacterium]
MRRPLAFVAAALWLGLCPLVAQAVVKLPLLSYYDYEPFMRPDLKGGLTHELAAWLNKRLAGRYRFVPSYLPKGRVDMLLQNPAWAGALVWVDPGFVDDAAQRRYHWSVSLLEETDQVASRSNSRFEYAGPGSLEGLTLGTVVNQHYPDVETLLQQGRVHREDAPSQEANLNKLLLGRVDVAFVSASTLAGLRGSIPQLDSRIHLSAQVRRRFSRRLMLSQAVPAAQRHELMTLLERLDCDAEWQVVLKRYGLIHKPAVGRCR